MLVQAFSTVFRNVLEQKLTHYLEVGRHLTPDLFKGEYLLSRNILPETCRKICWNT